MTETAEGAPVVTESLPRMAESASMARDMVRQAVETWGLAGLADSATLVVTELVANAVMHAQCDTIRVTVTRVGQQRVRVAVIDRAPASELPQQTDPLAEGGRGLFLVEAMSAEWGIDDLGWGKRVWGEVVALAPADDVPMYSSPRAQLVYALIVAGLAALIIFASLTQ
ncbi:ATP-binding protein [Streptomyces sp. NPDC004528]|uniref:ATP-binding protein n=1 Tax=Streptomyces sp. NPDC004528 TaxID=3154550 RepID=UPI0033A80E03